MSKIYIGYQGDLPVRVESSREIIESDPFLKVTHIKEHEGKAELVNGVILFDDDIDKEKNKILEKKYTDFIQNILDKKAQELNYDNIASVCTYENCGVLKFHDEAVAYKKWRAKVWEAGYKILDEVKSGIRAVPTEEELAALLPKLELVYTDTSYTPSTGE